MKSELRNAPKKSILVNGYRLFQRKIVKQFILPFWIPQENHFKSTDIQPPSSTNQSRVIWIHAASVGELESLIPLIQCFADHQASLIITILSPSAKKALSDLQMQLGNQGKEVLYSGFAPWEGEWKVAFQRWRPTLFITAKYEAWPDLWLSLSEAKIPLAIVSARVRKSLKVAKWFCEKLADTIPELVLFACTPEDAQPLKALFPSSQVQVVGEPRWDRVFARSKIENLRAQDLIRFFQKMKKPWGVIGSAWIEDLRFLKSMMTKFSGTLWIVPHQIHGQHLNEIITFLKFLEIDFIQTSELKAGAESISHPHFRCILVDELGFLLELYSVADWVFVGGGFGAGIHSTIEPAIQGVPIGIGPNGASKFSEVHELEKIGQLQILRNELDLGNWMEFLEKLPLNSKEQWQKGVLAQLGATQKIWSILEK